MAIPVILSREGLTVYPATILDAIIDPETGSTASIVADGLTSQAKSDIIESAVASVTPVTSVILATSAETAYGIDDTLKAGIITSAVSAVPEVTSVASAASATMAYGLVSTLISTIVDSAVDAFPGVTSVLSATSADIAYSVADTVKEDIISSASANNTPSTAAYTGPFSVHISDGFIYINSGILYLGGTESSIAATSVASADGNVYFYMYYNDSYISGFEIASSANALTNAASITGSAGYYTAIANINNNMITQYQYGNISINGRIQS